MFSWQGDNSNIKKKKTENVHEERFSLGDLKLCLRLGRLAVGYSGLEKKVINENLHEIVVVGNKIPKKYFGDSQ